jgi:predicted dehydrogenase
MTTRRIGIIGLGKMGFSYFELLSQSPRWEVVSVCDINEDNLKNAQAQLPNVKVYNDPESIFADETLEAVGIFTYADIRPQYIRRALAAGKHILAEKPLGLDIEDELRLADEIEQSGLFVAVNLFNRSAWYHKEMRDYIAQGEIGQLAVIRISHQTAGGMPGDTLLDVEGPPFHTCGMHYLDVARWYANSEFDRWDAQGIKMWDWKDPWWVNAHGSFKNGIVFDVTQGFNYGQLSQTRTNNSSVELLGTLGLIRMQHDFKNVAIEFHGVNSTEKKVGPYGGKKLDVLIDNFTKSLDEGVNVGFPTARDSVIASHISQEMLKFATEKASPSVGTSDEMERIMAHRRVLNLRA